MEKMKVEYVEDETVNIDGETTTIWLLPKCPACDGYPTYNINPCPFCGQELEYPKDVDVEEHQSPEDVGIKHKWELSQYTTPSGKILYHCPKCGLYDCCPVKPKFETRECIKDKYKDCWEVKDGKIYARF